MIDRGTRLVLITLLFLVACLAALEKEGKLDIVARVTRYCGSSNRASIASLDFCAQLDRLLEIAGLPGFVKDKGTVSTD